MSENNMLYGESSQVKVSFAYGTITQAAADTYPGGIAFGYDAETNAGAIFRMGKLVTSRILDITLSNAETENMKEITVKFVDTDGLVQQKKFTSVDETLINSLKSRIATLEANSSTSETGGHNYQAGDYVDINAEYKISVKYADLYAKVKTDLIEEGVITPETAHTVVEEGDYIKVDTSLNKSTVSIDYDSVYEKVKADLVTDEFAKTSDIPSLDEYAKLTDVPSLDGYAKLTDIPSLDEYAKTEDIVEYVGSEYVNVAEGSGENEGKEVVSVKYTELYNQVKSDLASAGIGDTSTIDTEQSARILGIENSYLNDTSVVEEENATMKSVSISLKKRASEGEEFVNSEISFDVPTDKYYEDIDSSINSVEERVSALESAGPSTSVEWLDVSTLLAQANA